VDCSNCKSSNPTGKRFCADCGAPLNQICAACGAEVMPGKRFCGDCGASLTGEAGAQMRANATVTPSSSSEPAIGAERRQLTVMFCDLVGSTAMSSRLDPEDMRDVIGTYQKSVAATVAGFHGFVAKYLGDGVLVYFGYPQAHEDDPEQAIRAALGCIERLAQITTAERLGIRIGIATGLTVVGDLIGSGAAQEHAVVGETPNVAARLQSLAEPNTVVISDTTRRLVGSLFKVADLGLQELKGLPEPQRAWRVLETSDIESRFDAMRLEHQVLIGREEELELLSRRWTQAKSGSGRVVLISGEPGIGKSRLTAALTDRLRDEPHFRLRYFCSPHHRDSALHPMINRLERAARFGREDTTDQKRDKLNALLDARSTSHEDHEAFAELLSVADKQVGGLASLSPQRRKERTFAALIRQLEALSTQRPVLMLWEDVHWLDPTSREFLGMLVARIPELQVLLLISFRPEFVSPWTGQAHVNSMNLSRLGREENAALVKSVTGGRTLPSELIAQIISHTDGVPLFVEELTKAILESGLIEERGHELVLTGPLPRMAIPTTLQASLMARLDRLSDVREVVQIASAIGREFSFDILAAVSGKPSDKLENALNQLVQAELVHARGEPPDATYIFKHALIQDAAYATLLRSARTALHARIAAILNEQYPDVSARQPEMVARHYTEAGLAVEAIDFWLSAGRIASERSSHVEAVSHLKNGLDTVRSLPEGPQKNKRELDFLSMLGPALVATKGYSAFETEEAYVRSRSLIETTGDDTHLETVLSGLFIVHYNKANHLHGVEIGQEALALAEVRKHPVELCSAHRMLAAGYTVTGEFQRGLEHADRGLEFYDQDAHAEWAWRLGHDVGVGSINNRALALWHLGYPDQSKAAADRALAIAEQRNHANTLGIARFYSGVIISLLHRDSARMKEQAEQLISVGKLRALPQWATFGQASLAPALADDGRFDDAITTVEEAISACEAIQNKAFRSIFACFLGQVFLSAGRLDRAFACASDALQQTSLTRENWVDPELWRIKGQACIQNQADAGDCLMQGIDIARRQGSRSMELRLVSNLARLRRDQGQKREARDLLLPVYQQFTEGFKTPDFREATDILGEI
jgi:predicted ATPase/class 3 adenylate cyclase